MIEEYVQKRRDTIMEYAATKNRYEKCNNWGIASVENYSDGKKSNYY